MIKVLKITSLLSLIASAGFCSFLSIRMIQTSPERPAILDTPNIGDLRPDKTKAAGTEKESALVTQAKLFALSIDPPPPPPPPKPVTPTPVKPVTPVTPTSRPAPPVKPVISAKFQLVGTNVVAGHPERSLALLDVTSIGQKWYWQGDKINHQTIHEIKERSIVLYQDGRFAEEVPMVEHRSTIKSLLKSEVASASIPGSRVLSPGASPLQPPRSLMTTKPLPGQPDESLPTTDPGAPSGSSRTSVTRYPSTRTSIPPRRTTPIRTPPPVPSPEERKKTLDNNITDIKKLIAEPAPGATKEMIEEEKKAWETLLKLLEEEKDKIGDEPSESKPGADK